MKKAKTWPASKVDKMARNYNRVLDRQIKEIRRLSRDNAKLRILLRDRLGTVNELCSKKKCDDSATVIFKVSTEKEPVHFAFCHSHLETAIKAITAISKFKPVKSKRVKM